MICGGIVAGLFNSQRTKRSDKVWTFQDVHPDHVFDTNEFPDEQSERLALSHQMAGIFAGLHFEQI